MEDFIEKKFTWISVKKQKPQMNIVFTLGGQGKINAGALVKRDGGFVWHLVTPYRGMEFVEVEEFPYWADIPNPFENRTEVYPGTYITK